MADQKLRAVRGTFRVKEGAVRIPHEEGFRHALDNALKKTGWPRGVHSDVRVEFSATIEVVNPGRIVEYAVRLQPPTG